MANNLVKIFGSTVSNEVKPISLFKQEIIKAKVDNADKTLVDLKHIGFNKPVDVSWLSRASSVYEISPNIKDYVVVPVGVITAGIPNRNCQGFCLEDLTEFSPDNGCLRYKTFIGKPTHIDHQSDFIEKAKGVNLDASVVYVPKYNVAKIVVLSAFCRQKDPKLANDIFTGKRKNYSMGAVATAFICSVCGGKLGPAIVRTCRCMGTDFTQLNTLGSIKNGTLHYHMAKNFTFVENSSVEDPADVTATADVL